MDVLLDALTFLTRDDERCCVYPSSFRVTHISLTYFLRVNSCLAVDSSPMLHWYVSKTTVLVYFY